MKATQRKELEIADEALFQSSVWFYLSSAPDVVHPPLLLLRNVQGETAALPVTHLTRSKEGQVVLAAMIQDLLTIEGLQWVVLVTEAWMVKRDTKEVTNAHGVMEAERLPTPSESPDRVEVLLFQYSWPATGDAGAAISMHPLVRTPDAPVLLQRGELQISGEKGWRNEGGIFGASPARQPLH